MGEFELIQRYFSTLTASTQGVVLGIGDDAAILQIPVGEQLVVTVDTSNADVHFPSDADAFAIGYRALAVNLSDLAAMGAVPRWFTLSLTLPEVREQWLSEFSCGLAQLSNECGVALVGGDTTRGSLAISIQAMGTVPEALALTRAGAKPGDLLYVSGSIGDAAAGLACYRRQLDGKLREIDQHYLRERYLMPSPRVALGIALRGIASSCIDISDGLVADAGHIAERSRVSVVITADQLPASVSLLELPLEQRLPLQLSGGDDYELCFTAPPSRQEQVAAIAERLGIAVTRIGYVESGSGVVCVRKSGELMNLPRSGFLHFE